MTGASGSPLLAGDRKAQKRKNLLPGLYRINSLLVLRVDQSLALLLVVGQATRSKYFETMIAKYVRGTRGSRSAVSKSDDQLVLRNFAEPALQLPEGDIHVTLNTSELLDLLGFADIQKEKVLALLQQLLQLFCGEIFGLRGISRPQRCQSRNRSQEQDRIASIHENSI